MKPLRGDWGFKQKSRFNRLPPNAVLVLRKRDLPKARSQSEAARVVRLGVRGTLQDLQNLSKSRESQ